MGLPTGWISSLLSVLHPSVFAATSLSFCFRSEKETSAHLTQRCRMGINGPFSVCSFVIYLRLIGCIGWLSIFGRKGGSKWAWFAGWSYVYTVYTVYIYIYIFIHIYIYIRYIQYIQYIQYIWFFVFPNFQNPNTIFCPFFGKNVPTSPSNAASPSTSPERRRWKWFRSPMTTGFPKWWLCSSGKITTCQQTQVFGVWKCFVYPIVPSLILLIIIPFLNGYFIGKINPMFRQTQVVMSYPSKSVLLFAVKKKNVPAM